MLKKHNWHVAFMQAKKEFMQTANLVYFEQTEIKLSNKGEGFSRELLNSGWDCVAIKKL